MIAAADPDGLPIVVAPDGAEITSADAEAYAAAFDPEDGALLVDDGYTYKESAGVAFDASSQAWELVTQPPVISEDGLAMTLTYDILYVDYQYQRPVADRGRARRRRPRPRHRGSGRRPSRRSSTPS